MSRNRNRMFAQPANRPAPSQPTEDQMSNEQTPITADQTEQDQAATDTTETAGQELAAGDTAERGLTAVTTPVDEAVIQPVPPATQPTTPPAPALPTIDPAALRQAASVAPAEALPAEVAVTVKRLKAWLTGEGDAALSKRNYQTLMSTAFMTKDILKEGITLLERVTNAAIKLPHPAVLDVLWDFHKAHHDGLMSERSGLRGITHLDHVAHHKVATLFTVFHTAVAMPAAKRQAGGLTEGINAAELVRIFGDDRILSYLATKR